MHYLYFIKSEKEDKKEASKEVHDYMESIAGFCDECGGQREFDYWDWLRDSDYWKSYHNWKGIYKLPLDKDFEEVLKDLDEKPNYIRDLADSEIEYKELKKSKKGHLFVVDVHD